MPHGRFSVLSMREGWRPPSGKAGSETIILRYLPVAEGRGIRTSGRLSYQKLALKGNDDLNKSLSLDPLDV